MSEEKDMTQDETQDQDETRAYLAAEPMTAEFERAAEPTEQLEQEPLLTEQLETQPSATPPGLVPGFDPAQTWGESADHGKGKRDRAGALATARRDGPSVPTVVWGLLLGLIAAVALVKDTSDVDINFSVAVPLALLGAGAVLVLWGLSGLGRRRTQ